VHALTLTFITPYALDTVAQFPGWLPLAVRSLACRPDFEWTGTAEDLKATCKCGKEMFGTAINASNLANHLASRQHTKIFGGGQKVIADFFSSKQPCPPPPQQQQQQQQVKAEEQKDVGMVKSEEEVTGRVMKCEVKDEAEEEEGIGKVKCEEEVMGMVKAEVPADRSAASVDH